jgi:GGDEF domain-containing protein
VGGASFPGGARVEAEAATPRGPSRQIEIRDERAGEGPAAWIGSIGQQLQRFALDGLPFAVLLVELTEMERVRREQGAAAADRLALSAEELLSGELREPAQRAEPGARAEPALLTRERPGRYWLLAPGADRTGAKLLAERMARALGALGVAGGRPVAVAIGTASCPQDGTEAAALAAHADVGLYAARSAVRAATMRTSSAADRPL